MAEINLVKGELPVKIVTSIVIGVVIFVAWFYNSVIIPIQQIQTSLVQIQSTLAVQATANKNFDTRLNVVENKLNIPR